MRITFDTTFSDLKDEFAELRKEIGKNQAKIAHINMKQELRRMAMEEVKIALGAHIGSSPRLNKDKTSVLLTYRGEDLEIVFFTKGVSVKENGREIEFLEYEPFDSPRSIYEDVIEYVRYR